MKVSVTKNDVVIVECDRINEGEVCVNTCEFELPECFKGLCITAVFSNIPVPVYDNKCNVPSLKKGTAALGVYAYREKEDGSELIYSPKPTSFYVGDGSYCDEIAVESIPAISEFEQYCKSFSGKVEDSLRKLDAVSSKRHYNTFSVLGDSYSTFVDFVTPNTNLCWYPAGNENATGSNNDVSSIEQMWWHIFANQYESALQVNNSYSGSPICYDGWGSGQTDSAETGFIARANDIGTPELIFVFGGSNDDWVNASIGEYKYSDWTEEDFISLRPSLAYLLNYLKQHNAGAKIVFILNENLDAEIDASVLTICGHYGVEVIELENIAVSNGHPTIAGQASIAQQVYDFITSSKITEFTATITKNDFASGFTLDDLKPYLTVTATYDDGTIENITDYQLSGSVAIGTNTITVSYGVYTTTLDIVVSEVELTSISAQLSQTEFNMDVTFDNIKPYLTVTVHYADGSTSIVNDYTLSGELNVGENTITVSYGGKTTTVIVTVEVASGTYELSVETLDNSQYQYYCPVFNTPINESVRIVFTRDFELFSTNSSIKGKDALPSSLKDGGAQLGTVDISDEYVDQTISLTSEYAYFVLSIGTKAVNPLTLKNFHCYVDGFEVEPVDWVAYSGENEITVEKLA